MPRTESGRQLHNALGIKKVCTIDGCEQDADVTVNRSHNPVPRCTMHLQSRKSSKVVEDEYTLRLLREFGLI